MTIGLIIIRLAYIQKGDRRMKTEVEVVFLVTDDGPIFYGIFDSYLNVQDHFQKLGGKEKEGMKNLGCFEVGSACYTVQTNEVNKPLIG